LLQRLVFFTNYLKPRLAEQTMTFHDCSTQQWNSQNFRKF